MFKRRVSILLICICIAQVCIPYKEILAHTIDKRISKGDQYISIQLSNRMTNTTADSITITTLQSLIVQAESIYNSAIVGTTPGCYRLEDKQIFAEAIQGAKQVADTEATQGEIDKAIIELEVAIKVFESAIIKFGEGDINEDGCINIADLAIITFYHGKNSESEKWEEAKKVDVNKDLKIDIEDLKIITELILATDDIVSY